MDREPGRRHDRPRHGAVRLLVDLPADLLELGGTGLESESGRAKSAPWHRAVYSRPFDDHLDHHTCGNDTRPPQNARTILARAKSRPMAQVIITYSRPIASIRRS